MNTAEQIRNIVTHIADLQKTAPWETQVELARAAEILVKEAGRLEGARVDGREIAVPDVVDGLPSPGMVCR